MTKPQRRWNFKKSQEVQDSGATKFVFLFNSLVNKACQRCKIVVPETRLSIVFGAPYVTYVIQSIREEFDFHLAKARLWHRPTSGCPPASGYRPVPSYQAVQSEGPACPRDHLGLEGKTLQLQPRSPLGREKA